MPVVIKIEKRGEKEIEGGFKVVAKNVNMWVRIYRTVVGIRCRISFSYLDEKGKWKNTPPIWVNGELAREIGENFVRIADLIGEIT